MFLKHSTTHPLTIPRAQTSTAAESSNEPVQEVTIPSSSGLLSLELDVTLIKEFAHHPVGGCLSRFRKNWEKVTQDSWVLQTVQGLRLEFFTVPSYQVIEQPKLDVERSQALSKEVNKLCQKRAIIPTTNDGAGFVRPVFVIPKTGEKWCPVINLKALNVYVVAPHFKMESVRSVKRSIQKDDWLTKLDLKDAYLTVQCTLAIRNISDSVGKTKCGNLLSSHLCSIHIYNINEASGGNSEEVRDASSFISGRYAHNGKLSKQGQRSLSVGNLPLNVSQIYYKYGEKYVVSKATDRVFRLQVGFQDNDYFTASTETDDLVENNKTSSKEDTGIIERNIPGSGNNGSDTSSHLTSPTTLQTPGEDQNTLPQSWRCFRQPSPTQRGHPVRQSGGFKRPTLTMVGSYK